MNKDRGGYLIFRQHWNDFETENRERGQNVLKVFRDDLLEWKEFKENKIKTLPWNIKEEDSCNT